MIQVKGKNIKYIIVETILENQVLNSAGGKKTIVEIGLFQGIKVEHTTSGDLSFYAVVPAPSKDLDPKKLQRLFSVNAYNILSVEVFDGVVKHMMFFKKDDADQGMADDILRMLVKELKEDGRANENGMIDVEQYSNIPDNYDGKLKHTINTAHAGNAAAANKALAGTGSVIHHATGAATQNAAWQSNWNKERFPTFIRRKDPVVTEEEREALLEKLKMLKAGTYVWTVPELKAPEATAAGAYPAADLENDDAWGNFMAG